jgi:hypothetical protein
LKKIISTNGNVSKYSQLFFTIFFDLEEIIFEIFNLLKNKCFEFPKKNYMRNGTFPTCVIC